MRVEVLGLLPLDCSPIRSQEIKRSASGRGISWPTVYRHLERAEEEGQVVRTEGGRDGRRAVSYRLSPVWLTAVSSTAREHLADAGRWADLLRSRKAPGYRTDKDLEMFVASEVSGLVHSVLSTLTWTLNESKSEREARAFIEGYVDAFLRRWLSDFISALLVRRGAFVRGPFDEVLPTYSEGSSPRALHKVVVPVLREAHSVFEKTLEAASSQRRERSESTPKLTIRTPRRPRTS